MKKSGIKKLPYKVLLVKSGGYIFAKGYSLYSYDKSSNKATFIGGIPDRRHALFSRCRLSRRFFRAEITGLYELCDGSLLAIAKKGLFKSQPDAAGQWMKCFTIPRG